MKSNTGILLAFVRLGRSLALPFSLALCITADAAEYQPPIAPASDEGEQAIGAFEVQDGFAVELFAAEPMLANPVCFYIDHQGRAYVAETFRHQHGVTDMRQHTDWLHDDLASRNNEDRLIAMKKNLGTDFATYTEAEDRVRLIEDTDGDGRADRATVFADGFNDALAGIGAGLLYDRGDVFWTCIPELWKLRDADGDGVAEYREVLSSGYGVHINFLGHDLHGLRKGPDGRIYFSIGDRGVYIKTFDGKVIDEPDTGTVLRCNPDGSGLEVVHRGLRNPQELAFDDYGNLFTGDNNSDAGDQARWVYIVDGGDSGWRIGWQWITNPNPRGPWNAEKMWHTYHEGQPAHILPPLANIGAGPSGLTHYPGTGLPERYNAHFFLCDFRGNAGMSLIHAFGVEPKGAAFDVVDRHDFIKHVLATDVDFGMDGGIYLTDWVQGWDQPLKGRMYRVFAPDLEADALVAETKQLLADGMQGRGIDDVMKLMGHTDQRVRFEAQYAIADIGERAASVFAAMAKDRTNKLEHARPQLARLHAVWGLWQLAIAGAPVADALRPLLKDDDAEVRAQAAKVWAETPDADGKALIDLLNDKSDRVKFFAAIGLWKNPPKVRTKAFTRVVKLLRANDGADPYLRHAGVMGLLGCGDADSIAELANDESEAVRLGALLALRRLCDPGVAAFLDDESDILFAEAVRAINDGPVPEAFEALAEAGERHRDRLADAPYLQRRVINAHYRLGQTDDAAALAELAIDSAVNEDIRVAALERLGAWAGPETFDAVTNAYQPLAARDAEPARAAIAKGYYRDLLKDGSEKVQQAGARLVARFAVQEAEDVLMEVIADADAHKDSAVEALRALAAIEGPRLGEAIEMARVSSSSSVRLEALAQLAKLDAESAVPMLADAMGSGDRSEQRQALSILAGLDHPAAGATIGEWFSKFRAGEADPAIQVEIVEAARASHDEGVRALVAEYDSHLAGADDIERYAPALQGGNSITGRRIFFDKIETSCVRCHMIDGMGGGEVGPDLSDVGARVPREYILEAVALPSRSIAEGYESVMITTTDGIDYTGRVVRQDDSEYVLEVARTDLDAIDDDPFAEKAHSIVDVIAEDSGESAPVAEDLYVRVSLPKDSVESVRGGLSSMPEDLIDRLSLAELRDLVEYLSGRK